MNLDPISARVRDLRVELSDRTAVVRSVSFDIARGSVLGLVGESGCGKTTTALALLGYSRRGTHIAGGSVDIDGVDVLKVPGPKLRRLRGRLVAYVPQDPALALSPAMKIGAQLNEVLKYHSERADASDVLREHLELVQLSSSDEFLQRYPHQLSGGQQQRVAIAMALIARPSLIVLDEPTTGLDVTTQARVLGVIAKLREEFQLSLLYVTHDLGVVSHFADDVAVMYSGVIVEQAPTNEAFSNARHPYTRRLIAATPRSDVAGYAPRGIPGIAVAPAARPDGCAFAPRCSFRTEICVSQEPGLVELYSRHTVACFNWEAALAHREPQPDPGARRTADVERLVVDGLSATYARRGRNRGVVLALADVSFAVHRAECLAIVGESGSGKTTLGRCLVGTHAPQAGTIALDGGVLAPRARRRTREERRRIQIVFQNPDRSLNPRHTVAQLIARPLELFLDVSASERAGKVREALDLVRLASAVLPKLPSELSGGEKQRVAIARALAARPDILVCDEITSALDVSVQAAILELVADLQAQLEMALIFISHDLAVVRSIADRILVLEQGAIQELQRTEEVFTRPQTAYTRTLIDAQREWSLLQAREQVVS